MKREKKRTFWVLIGLILLTLVLFTISIFVGSVNIPIAGVIDILSGHEGTGSSWGSIIMNSRLPMTITALFAGSSLAVSGLLMQTMFRNPLAGPSVLGVSSGASLGVAVVILLAGGLLGQYAFFGNLSIIMAALLGAGSVILLLLFLAARVGNNVVLLIIGLMIGYAVSSMVNILQYFSVDEDLHAYVIWGMGSFSQVGWNNMLLFGATLAIALASSVLLMKPLNMMLLGDNYARNLGLNMKRSRVVVISLAGIMAAVVTAFCGPIAFVGIAVPHIARNLFQSNDHKIILPGVILAGASFAVLCSIISRLPGVQGALPVNAISSLIGAPIVIWVIIRKRKRNS